MFWTTVALAFVKGFVHWPHRECYSQSTEHHVTAILDRYLAVR